MLYKQCMDVINLAKVKAGVSGVKIPNVTAEYADNLEVIFKQVNLDDISDDAARAQQDAFSNVCFVIRGNPASPKSNETISILLHDSMQTKAGALINENATLSAEIKNFYFNNSGPASVKASQADINKLIANYKAAKTDDMKKLLLASDRQNVDRFQNWKTKAIAEAGLPLPTGISFTKGVSGAVINGNLFDFHVFAGYLRQKRAMDSILATLYYLESTSGKEKEVLKPLVIPELGWLCNNPNALLVPGFRLTKSKILASIYLIQGKEAGSIAALTFINAGDLQTLDLLSALMSIVRSHQINDQTASIINSVSVVIRRVFQPRSYYLPYSRLDLSSYTINNQNSDWWYVLGADLLMKPNYTPAGALSSLAQKVLAEMSRRQKQESGWTQKPLKVKQAAVSVDSDS